MTPTATISAGFTSGLITTRAGLVGGCRTIGTIVSRVVTAVHIGRMASALNSLSDAQLARIGVQRHEILNHAEKLVLDDEKDLPR